MCIFGTFGSTVHMVCHQDDRIMPTVGKSIQGKNQPREITLDVTTNFTIGFTIDSPP